MASGSKALLSSTLGPCSLISSSSASRPHHSFCLNLSVSSLSLGVIRLSDSSTFPSISKNTQAAPLSLSFSFRNHICRAAEYKFPDPIPEFADAETEKFRNHLLNKLAKKDLFGDKLEEVVGICTEVWTLKLSNEEQIFSTFLHSEYGGPGTLLVIPFIDMADTVNKYELPGGPQAARAAVKWAQKHVDKDWKEWTGDTD